MRSVLTVLAFLLLLAVPAGAQVRNPSAVTFTPSPDHALVDSYELDFLRPDGTVLQTLNIGKPTPDGSNVCTATINVQPITFGAGYTVQVRAKAGSISSDNAVSENRFDRVPGGPSHVIIKGGSTQ